MKKRILYANANYEEVVRDNGYFVDKTPYIARLETMQNLLFLNSRRLSIRQAISRILRRVSPEAKISQYVIYCFGNREFKVFDV